jgi:hypothetical protein
MAASNQPNRNQRVNVLVERLVHALVGENERANGFIDEIKERLNNNPNQVLYYDNTRYSAVETALINLDNRIRENINHNPLLQNEQVQIFLKNLSMLQIRTLLSQPQNPNEPNPNMIPDLFRLLNQKLDILNAVRGANLDNNNNIYNQPPLIPPALPVSAGANKYLKYKAKYLSLKKSL